MSTNAQSRNTPPGDSKKATTQRGQKSQLSAADFTPSLFSGLMVLLVVAFAAYSPVFSAGFIWDDDAMVWNNALIRAKNGLLQIWFSTNQSDYFPMTYTSLWFDWHFFAGSAKAFHIINVLFHGLSSFFLWRALRYLKIPGAFWAALLFVVHPVNVESVAWIAERKNTLSMFFFSIALLYFARFEAGKLRAGDTNGWRDYRLALIAFQLALLAKTAVVVFPFIALGCIWWLHGKISRKDLLRLSPFFGFSLVLGLVTIWFQYNRAIDTEIVNEADPLARLAIAGWNIWFYLGKTLLPLKLTFVYPRWQIDSHQWLHYLPTIAVVAVAGVLWAIRSRIGRGPFFAFSYFIIGLLPVLGFLNIYFFRYSYVADHYQYFALIGIVALVAGAATHYLGNRTMILIVPVAAMLLVLTWRQSHIYQNFETLWRDTLKKNPTCAMAESNWGYQLAENGRANEALEHYQAALTLNPKDSWSFYNYGVALITLGRVGEGVEEFRKALNVNPKNPAALQNLAWIEATSKNPQLRNPEHALEIAKQAVDITKGRDEWKLDTYAAALAGLGRFEEAVTFQKQAIGIVREKGDGNAVADMERRLALYEMRRPFIEGD